MPKVWREQNKDNQELAAPIEEEFSSNCVYLYKVLYDTSHNDFQKRTLKDYLECYHRRTWNKTFDWS